MCSGEEGISSQDNPRLDQKLLFTIWFTPWLLPVLRTRFSACAPNLAMFTLTPIPQW